MTEVQSATPMGGSYQADLPPLEGTEQPGIRRFKLAMEQSRDDRNTAAAFRTLSARAGAQPKLSPRDVVLEAFDSAGGAKGQDALSARVSKPAKQHGCCTLL